MVNLNPKREITETYDDYRKRRTEGNRYIKLVTVVQQNTEPNRAELRQRQQRRKLRLTKPLRKIRNRLFIGDIMVGNNRTNRALVNQIAGKFRSSALEFALKAAKHD